MKGISPILAAGVLICITLIVTIATAGFVFNVFGTFDNFIPVYHDCMVNGYKFVGNLSYGLQHLKCLP